MMKVTIHAAPVAAACDTHGLHHCCIQLNLLLVVKMAIYDTLVAATHNAFGTSLHSNQQNIKRKYSYGILLKKFISFNGKPK